MRSCVVGDYKPSIWGNNYIQSLPCVEAIERDTKRLDELKEEVGLMIDEETMVVDDKLELIDAIQQLGIGYHFEKEIKHALDSMFSKLDDLRMETKDNAYIIALLFRLLRGHGFIVSQALFNATNDIAYEVMKEKGFNILPYLKSAWTDLCKAYLVEAKWYDKSYIPTLEEYLQNGWLSMSGHVVLSYTYCLAPNLTQQDLDLFQDYPESVRWSSMIARLCNDLGTSKSEHQRGDVAKSIHCCMHHEGVTEAAARERIKELIYDCWKKLNGACLADSTFNEYFTALVVKGSRTAHCFYQHGDGYGSPEGETKDRVISLLIEPVQL
ncbi:Terpene synthase 10 [Ananas comosus]|uniref:Terpene synthase 10 n=1 Tax=Ananas comosus TaxID=4615 RepID=A0A199VFM6_ANACO|nr:Terpene synthase 10 [Ananas comosus]